MSRWSRKKKPAQQSEASSGDFHPVTVKREAQASASTLVVHGPGGMRVEGLTLKQVALLLRELTC